MAQERRKRTMAIGKGSHAVDREKTRGTTVEGTSYGKAYPA